MAHPYSVYNRKSNRKPNVFNCKHVCCDWCLEDVSNQEPVFHYAPDDFAADGTGYVRLCHRCKEAAVLKEISV